MELRIKENNYTPIIVENFDEIKALVQDKADHYKNMVYDETSYSKAKEDKATLNKFIKAIEDRRKEVKKACMQPYESFETQIKELVAICNEPVSEIDNFIKMIDSQKKAEKKAEIDKIFTETEHPEWLEIDMIFNPKWLNASVKLSLVETEIKDILKAIDSDIRTIATLDFSFEALEEYKRTLSLADAISKGQWIANMQARKNKEPEIKKPDYSAEQKNWIGFKAYITPSEARELRAWFVQKGIEIRA